MSEAILHFEVIYSLLSSTCQWELYAAVCPVKITWLCLTLQFRSYGYSGSHMIIKRKILICSKLNHSSWEWNTSVFTTSQLWDREQWTAHIPVQGRAVNWLLLWPPVTPSACAWTSKTVAHNQPKVVSIFSSSYGLCTVPLHLFPSALSLVNVICLKTNHTFLLQDTEYIKEPNNSRMADLLCLLHLACCWWWGPCYPGPGSPWLASGSVTLSFNKVLAMKFCCCCCFF